MAPDLTEEEMKSLTQSILTRYGVDFTCYEPKSLRRRIIRVMNNFELPSVHDLWVRFLRDANFIHDFMNEVSVGMTSMFRDPVLWKHLQERVKIEFQQRPLSVWHAGCSTGEEVFSFGIVLQETGLLNRAKAMATDFNQNALQEARQGAYHKIKMIENETNYREYNPKGQFERYYSTDGKSALMNPDLIQHATFRYHNLITDEYPRGFDIIFCRNVMIYFDGIAKNRILTRFYEALNPGGYLIIGFFDTMSYLLDNRQFFAVDEEAKIFQKK